MGKNRTLTHDERERINKDYREAYRLVKGREGFIEYRRGWFYLMAGTVGVPFSAKEIECFTESLRRRIPQRADSEEDSFQRPQ